LVTTITTEFVLCAVTWASNTQGIPNITNAAPCRTLQHDPMRNEDLATDSDDHAADALRYGCMARPWLAPEPPPSDIIESGYMPFHRDEFEGDFAGYSIKTL
jgi:hypothetical protein